MIVRVALAACLLGAAAAAEDPGQAELWLASGFERAKVRWLEPEFFERQLPQERLLDLTLVRLDGSPWSEKRILGHLQRTAETFAPCGIGLGSLLLARVRAPGGRHDFDLSPASPAPAQVVKLASLLPAAAPRPVVFFAGRLFEAAGFAQSFQRGDVGPAEARRYPYMNTAWIAYRAHWMERSDPRYSTLAHELAHLLCRCGHRSSPERHLLNSHRNRLSSEIEAGDCETFRRSDLLRSAR